MHGNSIRESTLYICLLMFYDLLLCEVFNFNTAIILMGLFAWSFYYVVKVNQMADVNRVIKALNWLLILFTIYGVFLVLSHEQLMIDDERKFVNTHYLITIYNSLLPIYAFYYFSRKRMITCKTLRRFIPFWILLATLIYFHAQADIRAFLADDDSSFTNNAAYLFLSFFPAVVLFNKRVIQYVVIGVILFFVALGVKRGAIVVSFICLLYYLNWLRKSGHTRIKIRGILAALVIAVIAGYFFYSFYMSNDYFQLRVEQTISGNSSNRDTMYSGLLNYYFNQGVVGMIIGNGAASTIRIYGDSAHNDWLEVLINQGIIGFSVFLVFCYQIVKNWKKINYDTTLKVGFGLFAIFFLTRTFFSMSYNSIPYYATAVFGYYLSCIDTRENLKS